MAGKDRKRQIARERYQRRMAALAAARAKRRQRMQVGGAAAAVLLIVGVVAFLAWPDGKKAAAKSSPVAAASSTPPPPVPVTAAGCTTKLSTVASPIAGFPSTPPGSDSKLKTEPIVTIPAGTVPTKLTVKDLVVGTGGAVGPNDSVTVNYIGVNYVNCAEFDSSWKRSAAQTFSLTGVIKGFSKGIAGDATAGIAGMKVGGRRELIMPPSDGYGVAGQGAVGPNEELVFVVDMLKAASPTASPSPSASTSASPSASKS